MSTKGGEFFVETPTPPARLAPVPQEVYECLKRIRVLAGFLNCLQAIPMRGLVGCAVEGERIRRNFTFL